MSARVGTRNGMPASRMRRFARTSRCAIVAGSTPNAPAIAAASNPSTVCSMSGVRMAGSIAGCAQANSSSSRLSGIASLCSSAVSASTACSSARAAAIPSSSGTPRAVRRGAQGVAQAVASHGDQPPFGIGGDAGIRPRAQRTLERVGEGVLGEGEVAGLRGDDGQDAAVGRPRGAFGDRADVLGGRHQWAKAVQAPSRK